MTAIDPRFPAAHFQDGRDLLANARPYCEPRSVPASSGPDGKEGVLMPPQDEHQEREVDLFEERFAGLFDLTRRESSVWPGNHAYKHEHIESMWYGWQARAALAVRHQEQPVGEVKSNGRVTWYGPDGQLLHRLGREARDALHLPVGTKLFTHPAQASTAQDARIEELERLLLVARNRLHQHGASRGMLSGIDAALAKKGTP
jgi:hypothetical protein